jgi:hypothetical protein
MVMAAMTGDPVFTESQAYDTLGLGPCEEQARIDREERQAYAAANYLGDVPADDPISSPVGGTVATVLVVLDPGHAMHAMQCPLARSVIHLLRPRSLGGGWLAGWLRRRTRVSRISLAVARCCSLPRMRTCLWMILCAALRLRVRL